MKAENFAGQPFIEDKPERPYLGMRFQTPFQGMFAVATRHLKALRQWGRDNPQEVNGPFFMRYYHCDMGQTMDVEVGLITHSPLQGHGPFRSAFLPQGRYLRMVYRGNGLRGNQALMQWAANHSLQFDPLDANEKESYVCRYEAYLTDYRVEPRKLLWDIELSIKLADTIGPTTVHQSTESNMATEEKAKGPASYFPSIEKKYGHPIAYWLELVAAKSDMKHMEIVTWLKSEHVMGHGHANAIVAYVLSGTGKRS